MKHNTHIHEAGHAVAAIYVGLKFKSIDIFHVEKYLGMVSSAKLLDISYLRKYGFPETDNGEIERNCIFLMAGMVCVAKNENKKFSIPDSTFFENREHDLSVIHDLSEIAICNNKMAIKAYM